MTNLSAIPRDWPNSFTTIGLGLFALGTVLAALSDSGVEGVTGYIEAFSTLDPTTQIITGFLVIFLAHFSGEFYMAVSDVMRVASLNRSKHPISAKVHAALQSKLAEQDYLRCQQTSRLFSGASNIIFLVGFTSLWSYFLHEDYEIKRAARGILLMLLGFSGIYFLSRLPFEYFDNAYLGDNSRSKSVS